MMSTELAATAIDIQIAMHPPGAVLKRKGVGSYVGGRWVNGPDEPSLPIAATVHAMRSKDILDLPEGLRHTDMRVIHTRVELRAHTDDIVGDVIEYKGRDYKVLQIRERHEGAFTRAVIGHNDVRTNTI